MSEDYTGGSFLTVDEVTNIAIGDRIWIDDGTNIETDIVVGVTATTISIQGQFMNDYLAADGAYIFTDTSEAYQEPEWDDWGIDMRAYGKTPDAGPIHGYYCGESFALRK